MAKPVRLTLYVDNAQLKKAFAESGQAADKFEKGLTANSVNVSKAAVAIGTAVGTAAVDIAAKLAKMALDAAVWLPKLGAEFDKVADHIRVSVGNKLLPNLAVQQAFQSTFATTASGMNETGNAVTLLFQRLGLTGQPLTDLSKQLLDLSRITGTDLASNLEAVTTAFNIFNVPADQMGQKLDYLFKASQASGVPLNQLASDVQNNAAQLQLLGLSFEDAASASAQLGKAGVSLDDLGQGFKKLIATAVKNGKPLSTVFDQEVKGIQNGSITMEQALADLGNRGGSTFISLAKSGKLNFGQISDAINANTDTIAQATKDTEDWPEKWKKAWNQLEEAVKPVANRVFGFIGQVIDKMTVKGLDGQTIVGLDIAGAWKMIADEWDKDWETYIKPFLDKIWGRIQEWWDGGGKDQTIGVAKTIGSEIGSALGQAIVDNIGSFLENQPSDFLWGLIGVDPGGGRTKTGRGNGVDRNGIPLDASGVPISPYNADGSYGPGGRAMGGPVTAGMPYIVGEHRRELFVPKVDGTIVPSTGMGGKGDTFNIHTSDPRLAAAEVIRQRRKQAFLAGAR